MQKTFLLTAALILTGCGTLKTKTAQWPWTDKKVCQVESECRLADALEAYAEASYFCREVHNYYERNGFVGDGASTAIGVVGALSGAVAAPLASGSAAKAWAGLSGATNAMQTNMNNFMSSALAMKRQSAVREAIDAGGNAFINAEGLYQKQVILSIQMANQCWSAAGAADEKVLKSLVE